MATFKAGKASANLTGTESDDVMNGGFGDDTFDGGNGNDILNGGAGADSLSGGEGNDQLHGGAGDDVLDGGIGNDMLVGGGGNDVLTGGAGDDVLNGGGGADTYNFSFTTGSGGTTKTLVGELDFENALVHQGVFSSDYSNFLAEFGVDGTDTNADVDVDFNHTDRDDFSIEDGPVWDDPNTTDVESYPVYFEDPDSVGVFTGSPNNPPSVPDYIGEFWGEAYVDLPGGAAVESEDGHDTIVGFHWVANEDGTVADTGDILDFSGLDKDQFLASFVVDDSADVDGDLVNDTVVTIDGFEDWSLTLLGVSGHDLQAFADYIFGV